MFARILSAIPLALTLSAAPATAQEHWCDKDRSGFNTAERAVCATPRLVSLDKRMADVFYAELAGLEGTRRTRFETGQRQYWLPYRNSCEGDRRCLMQRYEARIIELTGAALPGPTEGLSVTPEGYIVDPSRAFGQVYDPRSDCWGALIDGSFICSIQKSQVNPAIEPALPSDGHVAWAEGVNALSLRIMRGLIDPAAIDILEASAPASEAGKIPYFLNALVAIRGY